MDLEVATVPDIVKELERRYGAGLIIVDYENRNIQSHYKIATWGPNMWGVGVGQYVKALSNSALKSLLEETDGPEDFDS